MTTQSEIVWNDLHRLSEDDQHELLARLLERIEPDENSDVEFNAELMHRAEELRVDPSAGIPWVHVLEKR